MSPKDDPTWPVCVEGHEGWCTHARQYFINNRDAPALTPGADYCVPVVPHLNLFARVNLGPTILNPNPVMCQMSLVIDDHDDLLSDDPKFEPLGLHTEGDGRIVICNILQDYIRGYSPPRCNATRHLPRQENMLKQFAAGADAELYGLATEWLLISERMCYPCYLATNTDASVNVDIQFNASSFGLDNTVTEPDGASAARNYSALKQLQERFGNGS